MLKNITEKEWSRYGILYSHFLKYAYVILITKIKTLILRSRLLIKTILILY